MQILSYSNRPISFPLPNSLVVHKSDNHDEQRFLHFLCQHQKQHFCIYHQLKMCTVICVRICMCSDTSIRSNVKIAHFHCQKREIGHSDTSIRSNVKIAHFHCQKGKQANLEFFSAPREQNSPQRRNDFSEKGGRTVQDGPSWTILSSL